MIATTALAKEYGARTLFSDVSLQLNAGSRYGLVGANGSGKSTFMRILAGDEEASEGTVTLVKRARVGRAAAGSLPRRRGDHPGPRDARRRGGLERADRAAAHRRQRRPPRSRPDGRPRGSDRRARRLHAGGAIAPRCWRGWGSPPPSTTRRWARCRAGSSCACCWRRSWSAASTCLLLDEPTNHLDILTIRWLEKFLADYAGCAVIISHDQRFLDNVTSHTLDVDYGTITLLQRRLFDGDGREGGGARPQGDGGRARRGRDRPQARVRRALRRQEHQGHPGPEPPQADRDASRSRSWRRARGAPRCCASSPSARAAARCWSWPASASRTATTTC